MKIKAGRMFMAALCCLGGAMELRAQSASVTADGAAANANAMLDVQSPATGAGKGFLAPRVTEAQRNLSDASLAGGLLNDQGDLRGGAAKGLLVYQIDGEKPGFYYNSSATATTAWKALAPDGVTKVVAGTGLDGGVITDSGTISVKFGADSGCVAAGDDSRFFTTDQKAAATREASSSQSGLLSASAWASFNSKSSLALGETSSTAYYGDKGKTAYDERGTWNGSAAKLDAATGRVSLGLGAAATKNVGTNSGSVAAGDDSRFLTTEEKAAATREASSSRSGLLSASDWSRFDTAYLARFSWDGSDTGLNADSGRASLGVDVVATKKSNLAATVAPTVQDDLDSGYAPGSLWVDVAHSQAYVCVDATTDSASWKETTNQSSSGTVTSVTATAPLTGGVITTSGSIGINQASATVPGYLSSTDWATFNTAYLERGTWNGSDTNLVAATGRASLGLGTAATTDSAAYATAAQGTKADSALQKSANLSDVADAAAAQDNLGVTFTTTYNVTSNNNGSYANDSFVFGSPTMNYDGSNTARFFFNKSLSAFRAGATASGEWDDFNVGNYSTAFGLANTASGQGAAVGGGFFNTASGDRVVVGGGVDNSVSGDFSAVGGGAHNNVSGDDATIAGGSNNTASGGETVIGGGYFNETSDNFAAVVGGYNNVASGPYSVIGGGYSNSASGQSAAVGGGGNNVASGDYSSALGGNANQALSFGEVALGLYTDTTGYSPASTTDWNAADRLLVVGNGNNGVPSNALVMLKDGSTTLHGSLTVDSGLAVDTGALVLGYAASAIPGQIVMHDGATDNDHTVALQSANGMASSFTLTLPGTTGTDGQALVTDGAGNLSFGGLGLSAGGTGATNADSARDNLGLGSAATTSASAYATAAQGTKADSALQKASNLADLADSANARDNLGVVFSTANNVTSNTGGSYVNDSFVFGSSTLDISGGQASRFFFDKSKSAFRAGCTEDDEWDDDVVGLYSTALGYGNVASGISSLVLGGGNNEADGPLSSVVGGNENNASNNLASVFGGRDNSASGCNAGVFGGQDNTASGNLSATLGGVGNIASSWAETVLGSFSDTEGYSPASSADWCDTDRLLVVGNGTGDSSRSNALVMLKDGSTTLHGSLTVDSGLTIDSGLVSHFS